MSEAEIIKNTRCYKLLTREDNGTEGAEECIKDVLGTVLVGNYEQASKDTKEFWEYLVTILYKKACPESLFKKLHSMACDNAASITARVVTEMLTQSDEALVLTILDVKHSEWLEDQNNSVVPTKGRRKSSDSELNKKDIIYNKYYGKVGKARFIGGNVGGNERDPGGWYKRAAAIISSVETSTRSTTRGGVQNKPIPTLSRADENGNLEMMASMMGDMVQDSENQSLMTLVNVSMQVCVV